MYSYIQQKMLDSMCVENNKAGKGEECQAVGGTISQRTEKEHDT